MTPQANLYCLVVADEVEGDDLPLGKKDGRNYNVKGTERSDGKLLGEFCATVTKTLGKNVETVHTSILENINLVIHNRIALAWKAQLQEQVFDMGKSGTLVPSQSPWSSGMVPVRKPDGSIGLYSGAVLELYWFIFGSSARALPPTGSCFLEDEMSTN